MNTITRPGLASVAAAAAFIALTACGTEVAPPAQDVGRTVEKDRTTPDTRNSTGNRMDFGDDYGKGEPRVKKLSPADRATRNRLYVGGAW